MRHLIEAMQPKDISGNRGERLLNKFQSDDEIGRPDASLRDAIIFFQHFNPLGNRHYTSWIINMYIKGEIDNIADLQMASMFLKTFAKVKQRLPNKDINSYSSLDQLARANRSIGTSNQEIKRGIRNGLKFRGVDFVQRSPDSFVLYKSGSLIGTMVIDRTSRAKDGALTLHRQVQPKYQRMGYGAVMHDFAEMIALNEGKALMHSLSLSDASKAWWRKRGVVIEE